MADTTTAIEQDTRTTGRGTTGGGLAVRSGRLSSEQGSTSIADTVVSKIDGIAARDVAGVHTLGSGSSRAMTALRERIPGSRTNLGAGVSVGVDETQTAVDIDLIAEYGVA